MWNTLCWFVGAGKNKTGEEVKYWINKVKAGEREARFGLVQYQMCFRNWWLGPRVLHVLFTDHHRAADLSPQATGQVLCPRVEYWLKAHAFTHARRRAHAWSSSTIQHNGYILIRLESVRLLLRRTGMLFFFFWLFSLTGKKISFSVFALQFSVFVSVTDGTSLRERRQTADSTNKLISITVLHASFLLVLIDSLIIYRRCIRVTVWDTARGEYSQMRDNFSAVQ